MKQMVQGQDASMVVGPNGQTGKSDLLLEDSDLHLAVARDATAIHSLGVVRRIEAALVVEANHAPFTASGFEFFANDFIGGRVD